MKEYFINLFNYDRHSNLLLLPAIFEVDQPKNAVGIMAHLLAAQQIWLNRCNGFTNTNVSLWPEWQADTFEQVIESNYNNWLMLMNDTQNSNLNRVIYYKSLQGVPFESKFTDILTHVINHGTHHRGQIGQHLKFAGIKELPILDYIVYTRI